MRCRNKKISALLLLGLTAFVSGCNLFEAVDESVNTTTATSLVSEGNDKLAEADYATALDRFERALEKENSDDAHRGRASAYAGLAGFDMFSALNTLQNGVSAPNSSAAIFDTARKITSLENLNNALSDMSVLNNPTNEDLLFRSIVAPIAAARTILEKYDTNLNKKLDEPDQINFTTNDNKTMAWNAIYQSLSSTNTNLSLEKAYVELTYAFDGRGTTWATMSPFNSVTKSGTYTQANYNTIEAVGNFAQLAKVANEKFSSNAEAAFKIAIMALDGAN